MATQNPDDEFDIGSRLRFIRTARRLSQRELARRAGVTNGLISQIENNFSSPSVASLKRILDALQMTLSEFFAADRPDSQIFYRASELRELNPEKPTAGKSSSKPRLSLRQVGEGSSHNLQVLHERYAPGASTGKDLYAHDAEEAGVVISGEIELTVGERTEILREGDAYIFDSNIPHRFRNVGEDDCVIVSACTPPSF